MDGGKCICGRWNDASGNPDNTIFTLSFGGGGVLVKTIITTNLPKQSATFDIEYSNSGPVVYIYLCKKVAAGSTPACIAGSNDFSGTND